MEGYACANHLIFQKEWQFVLYATGQVKFRLLKKIKDIPGTVVKQKKNVGIVEDK